MTDRESDGNSPPEERPLRHTLTYRNIPELAAYIDRIGAVELNYRRYMIKRFHGQYYHERCLIKIDDDGKITASVREYMPTKEEAEAIRSAIARHQGSWPKCTLTTDAAVERHLYPKMFNSRNPLFRFYDRKEGNKVIMCQERILTKKGKAYVPWTYWSDQEWRMMEPSGNLPFWKPKKTTNKNRIMIHEGAKCAEYCHRLTTDREMSEELAKHPWGEELSRYEHWGIIGGALAPHRARFGELIFEQPKEVVYVCDNDAMGKDALQEVSRGYRSNMKGMLFDDRWKIGWDLAEPFPEEMFKNGRYIGPSFESMLQPATWATEFIPTDGRGKPPLRVMKSFASEWCMCVQPEVYVHADFPYRLLTASDFNMAVRSFSDADDTARLLRTVHGNKGIGLEYSPHRPSGIYNNEQGERCLNTYVPSPVKAERGDVSLFLEFMNRLVSDDRDRHELMRWCATLVACPEVKMTYSVLLISEAQGVGKGTLGERILAPLVGWPNVSIPSETDMIDSNFNYWCAHKRLAVVHEIYQGHSSKAYNKLKNIITEPSILIHQKYMAPYRIGNWFHIFACSNDRRALQMSINDRRWFIPMITETKQPTSFWIEFYKWLDEEGGLGKIKHYMHEWIIENGGVVRGDEAPLNSTKRLVIEEGYSPGMRLADDIFSFLIERDKEEIERARAQGEVPKYSVTTDLSIQREIRNRLYNGNMNDRLERAQTIRLVAQARGMAVGKQKINHALYKNGRIISSDPNTAMKSWSELAEEGYAMAQLDNIVTPHSAA